MNRFRHLHVLAEQGDDSFAPIMLSCFSETVKGQLDNTHHVKES